MSHLKAHKLAEFKKSCRVGKNTVFIEKQAMETARRDFNLATQSQALKFIGGNGLENLTFINSTPYRKYASVVRMVDAYNFSYGGSKGYLAFWLNEEQKRWFIKSFKIDDQSNRPFKDLLTVIKE